MRSEAWASREDIGKALRSESLDEETLGETFARQDGHLEELRKALVGSLARIHDALDEGQRRRLAHWIESGGSWRRA